MAETRVYVEVVAGSRLAVDHELLLDHAWTDAGIGVDTDRGADITGAHLLLAAVGTCVVNDVYREARPGLQVDGVRVRVHGDFDADTWSTTRITYEVEVDSPDDGPTVDKLLQRVDEVAEIPRAVRGEVTVGRR